jgi:hypothetical protein
MSYKFQYFTQLIPTEENTTDFLIDILEKVLDSNLITQQQKDQLEYVLDSSFNQIHILNQNEYIENVPFSEFFFENCPSLYKPKTEIN